ncbi:SPFH domain/Band 7 family protein [Nocardioides albertanoniae]|uniref:SPFH domain/Band 7 family protein n=1 Tax=Nocardioides albertanoniae TaxID=1175486 RepID=A0A543AB18_9ACTN|nr:SPFH domain-containing protein [Nocardioides albertanoniae]TQL69747.1 SPFH domain/Band 7 family protein [Nocardioides albertanoniae]
MADIARYPFVRHLRGSTTTHVQHLRNGRVRHSGVGVSFWYRPLSAVLSEVPVDDRELPLLFHARTADFQDLTTQATVSFRIVDPAAVAGRIDFSVDPETGHWRGSPLDQVAGLLTETAQQYALDLIAAQSLADVLAGGVGPVRDAIAAGLAGDERLSATGLAILGVRVVALRPEPEVEKALLTPTRERVQADADKATYERRATAVQRERAISENELQNKIELARREEEYVAQRGTNARREAEENAAAARVATAAEAERTQVLAEASAQATRATGLARADAEAASLSAYRDLPETVLLGLALKEMAANLPQIEHLALTPDMLAPVLAKLGTRGAE